jgi:hypothetical protein
MQKKTQTFTGVLVKITKHKVKQHKVMDCIVMHGKTGTVTGDTVSYCTVMTSI